MSSGSRHTVVSLALLGASLALASGLSSRHRVARAPVHLDVPAVAADAGPAAAPDLLRVCADPNNLPFSNRRGEGFENRLADVMARSLGRRLVYYWQPQRRGFIRTALDADRCDVVIGVPASFERVRATVPYYRSTYVFVTPADAPPIRSFDDGRLPRLRIGVPVTGDDYANPPAAVALERRHLVDNIVGFSVFGDYSRPDPPRNLIDAVARGSIDVAIAWGPVAGYFAARQPRRLRITPVTPAIDGGLPFTFAIAMGVRRGNDRLASALTRAIAGHRREIDGLLAQFGVPRVPDPAAGQVRRADTRTGS